MNRDRQSQEDNEWIALAGTGFAEDWDNEKDSVYDNWRDFFNNAGGEIWMRQVRF